MRHGWIGLVAGLPALAGCDRDDPLRPGDVACLDALTQTRDFNVPLYQALVVCQAHVPPDLTGDARLQEQAIALQLPFQVRPRLDARLKFVRRWEMVSTGSAIPPVIHTYIPKVTVTEHD